MSETVIVEQAYILPENIDELVDQYVTLRNKLKDSDEGHKKKTRNARDYLEALNNKLLERLNDVGGESVKTKHGTVYRSTKRSATIADGDVFRTFITSNSLFDLVDWRANALAIEDYINENEAPPPGINFSTHYQVGVRAK
ncbi:hypothetical protein UFOVP55_28 [uncultured Caudovirales phage]|uniref:Uncharacterized protein n=1 Tax=uncultured Caudovirales phage TaxID=2100421 RepID=A0A6J5KUZ8_9CAUD|nr:hypothetical protein UFOVP55_28 [uncultured Caudovirales phage]